MKRISTFDTPEKARVLCHTGMQDRDTVILYTFSKKFAMTGWRLGAAIGPAEIIERIACLNTNEESCTTNLVQWAGIEAITGDQSGPQEILSTLKIDVTRRSPRSDRYLECVCILPTSVSIFSRSVRGYGLVPDTPMFRNLRWPPCTIPGCHFVPVVISVDR